jgi:hypothetical protein
MTNIENTLTANEAALKRDNKPVEESERLCNCAEPKSKFNGKLLVCTSQYPCTFSKQKGPERHCTFYDTEQQTPSFT